jgi:CRISPR-associated endonuclease Csn1
VEAAKGTNLFFVVYVPADGQGPRRYQAIPLRTAVEATLAGSSFVEEMPGYHWFVLSPNQLVYLPDEGEHVHFEPGQNLTEEQARKVYRFVSCDGAAAFFIPASVASIIIDKVEFEKMNKIGRAPDGRMIKEFCVKLNVDRLGRVSLAKLNSL